MVVVATSTSGPDAAVGGLILTLAIAEYFRDEGKDVMCMMDWSPALPWRETGASV